MAVEGLELSPLLGERDANLRLLEERFNVSIVPRGEQLQIYGDRADAEATAELLSTLLTAIRGGRVPSRREIADAIRSAGRDDSADAAEALLADALVTTHRGRPIRPRTVGQARYVRDLQEAELTFCIGPAGTGKTFLAMAAAINALKSGEVSRLVLTRPIVEAGEQLGFLPGDMLEKVDPYLRPLYDALHDIIGPDRTRRLRDHGALEVLPLAYMRGRTLNDAFMVLDEAQNATPGQVKMFLTRMGYGSRMVVTGDITQSDLPDGVENGLAHALEILEPVAGVRVARLQAEDIVRHHLVQRIVAAYADAEHSERSRQQQPHAETRADGGVRQVEDTQTPEQ
ncbi:MAG: PhoH family protein [Armatimonadetes bacterium]|nr:PhoH family protein [Armatimonadota bacterium]